MYQLIRLALIIGLIVFLFAFFTDPALWFGLLGDIVNWFKNSGGGLNSGVRNIRGR